MASAAGLDTLIATPSPLERFGAQPGSKYTVKPGDTLDQIAKQHGTTWQQLAKDNGLSNAQANLIRPGQQLTLPVGTSTVHIVKRGDTLSSIAAANGTTVAQLRANNPHIKNGDLIYPGDKIRIGGRAASARTGAAAASAGRPLPATPRTDAPPAGKTAYSSELGELSKKYETSGRGPGTISHGKGDAGGVSYGSYQLATNRNRPAEFLGAEGKRWASEFGSAKQGTEKFSEVWAKIAKREPEAFHKAQHDFIQRTHHGAQLTHIKDKTGIDLSKQSKTLQDVIWSTAVQHGPETNAIVKAMGKVAIAPGQPGYDKALIDAIYAERGKKNSSGELAYFSSSSAKVQAGVAERYVNELRDAQAQLVSELSGVKGAAIPASVGDGAKSTSSSEFVNPTGRSVRSDSGGDGHFGASRKRKTGIGKHMGLDILSTPGQTVKAPISGRLEISNPQNVHSGFNILSDDGKTIVKVFYAKYDPSLVGKRVNAGDVVAIAQDLQMRGQYPANVKDHVHVEVFRNGVQVNPKPLFFVN